MDSSTMYMNCDQVNQTKAKEGRVKEAGGQADRSKNHSQRRRCCGCKSLVIFVLLGITLVWLFVSIPLSIKWALELNKVKQKDLSRIDKTLEELKEIVVGSICQPCLSGSICHACTLGWQWFRGSCYYFSTTVNNWEAARTFCAKNKSHLAIINSEEEQYFLSNHSDAKEYWIGLSDKDKEGVFRWVDGSPLSLSFWQTNEPNSHLGEEDCVHLRNESGGQKKWNDKSCDITYNWICEKRSFCNLDEAGLSR